MRGSSSAKTISGTGRPSTRASSPDTSSAISARVPCPAPRNFTTYVPSSSPATMAGSEPPSRSGITYSVAVMVRIIGSKDTGIIDTHMTLAKGRMLGPYEIVSMLGAGGMGEVYRARDTRLNRTIAIKVLPAMLNANAALRERFEREARAISALSHPNICALYDIGNDDGTEFLVMEYLEGETLAERIARGPLPASQVLRIGVQIAEALQKAHRAGITHRDLKPGNIMITSSGAKLLDFGLAKFVEPSPRVFSEHSAPPTRLGPLTAEGTIVGTFQYMSPEQLDARDVDHRTDIFSLGVILYEMATGLRPIRGGSPASLVAAIMTTDPAPLRSLQPLTPPALERIILTALEKDP